MRRNVTVSLDEETARWVRVEARRDESVSRFLAEILSERRQRGDAYETARSAFMGRQPRPFRRSGTPLPGREEIHRRSPRRS